MRKVTSGMTSVVMAMFFGINDAHACMYRQNDDSPVGLRAQSEPVAVDRQCRTINIGIKDQFSLGPAQDLGNGRVFQSVGEDDAELFLADCNTRETTLLRGPVLSVMRNSCFAVFELEPLIGPAATIDIAAGDDLHELAETAAAAGARVQDPFETFFKFRISGSARGFYDDYDVGPKDRFNLFCGCDRFYPNSAGASQ